ncbi:MAG: membrane protein insertion efficiency factor YidD [Nitrospinaceae bacterium]|nr:membrane protein insertion efficiency factor YidD [Nitrospinaceae bacterium]NIR53872.1 membrane protein insertion efficiency factor YidD [Nitrospinaceae bacterium]NIS84286.1 membrane protein insertion efficiency factor YidD [Nitrospinaceae bacterium]NIT81093.1 membrane protein insertion efficiency factor YidD [Nitrospinaceae bacterium]NIU43375.1 membrane protein insertion efficiency factor YidD [Nitrospinaceae bacterium]
MVNRLLQAILRFYQRWISPMLMPACRFHPSCSEYSCQALEHHSFFKASWLILCRLSKCHPFHAGGHDPLK